MKRYLLAFALILSHGLIADRAQAQDAPKEFTVTVTAPELNKVAQALRKQPYEDVAELLSKLQQQAIRQQTPETSKVEPQK